MNELCADGPLSDADLSEEPSGPVKAAALRSSVLMAAIVMLCGLATQAGWLLLGRGSGVLQHSDTARPLLNVLLVDSAITAGLALVAALIQSRMSKAVAKARQNARRMRGIAAAAQSATNAKSIFLANMSHEVRTPLTAMLGYAELLRSETGGGGGRGMDESQRREAVEAIARNGTHLLTVINDLLDLSKAQASTSDVERLAVDPAEQAREAVSLLNADAVRKGLVLRVDVDAKIPSTIESDPTKIRQVLFNLVGNAVKFTEKGSVAVKCFVRDGPLPVLAFEVTDTGIGIAEDQLANLFKPYEQADSSTSRKFGGTGLGLALSRTLAQNLGGDINVKSQPGRGSTFCFTLPLPERASESGASHDVARPVTTLELPKAAGSAVATEPGRARVAGRGTTARVLVVDDSPDYQRLLVFMLRREGLAADTANNGREAVLAVSEREAAGKPYDLIMMDLQMPELDGCGAMRELRAFGCKSAIVAFTASALESDRERCIEAGCDEFSMKPIGREGLREVCDRWVGGTRELEAAPRRFAA